MTTPSAHTRQHPFGRTADGREVTCFTVQAAAGLRLEVLDYGAVVRALRVPDRDGEAADVVLGYDDLESYERDPFYLGAVIGRSANRIRDAAFVLDGKTYQLTANDGPHHLHGGARGFGKAVWRARGFRDARRVGVVLEHASPHGEEGYPGNLHVQVTYSISDAGGLAVEYRATTDHPTPVNLTQHSYFNLAGEGAGDVLAHELTVDAGVFTPLDASHLPTGALAPVAGTPLDFRRPHRIGARIRAHDAQLRMAGGYDHTFVLEGASGGMACAARLFDPASGRVLEVLTTEPGMQLYSGNFLDGSLPGKHGHRYGPCAGVCLETQHFPDAPNQPGFPSTILRPGDELRSRTEFRFSTQP
ncbi:MAG TPA: aldose epimerase family protein [Longimicrobiaceae bacterium]|nr:aldose epimerase family protein [Longimicrobiaceae bacterium]